MINSFSVIAANYERPISKHEISFIEDNELTYYEIQEIRNSSIMLCTAKEYLKKMPCYIYSEVEK